MEQMGIEILKPFDVVTIDTITEVKIVATHITLKEGGEWVEIINPEETGPLSKSKFNKFAREGKFYASYLVNHPNVKRAQAAAVKFSDDSVWDNTLGDWR
jgi:hypothetical protein